MCAGFFLPSSSITFSSGKVRTITFLLARASSFMAFSGEFKCSRTSEHRTMSNELSLNGRWVASAQM